METEKKVFSNYKRNGMEWNGDRPLITYANKRKKMSEKDSGKVGE